MEFDKSRVFSSVNADELRAGDKVIVGNTITYIKDCLKHNSGIYELLRIEPECYSERFVADMVSGQQGNALAYLVERKENCTNCGSHEVCGYVQNMSKFACFNRCENYTPKTEPKAEKKECCLNCKHYNKANDFQDCRLVNNPTGACPHYEAEQKAEKHYRPFRDTDELIKVWNNKFYLDFKPSHDPLTMPLIWVREKGCDKSADLITCYGSKGITVRGKGMYFDTLFEMFEFLDGSVCGVEE